MGDVVQSSKWVLYLVVNAQFRAAVAETCRCPALLAPCCRRPPPSTTTELLEFGCPLSIETAAAVGGSLAVEPATASASQECRHEQTFNRVNVEVSHNSRSPTIAWRRHDVADDNNGQVLQVRNQNSGRRASDNN